MTPPATLKKSPKRIPLTHAVSVKFTAAEKRGLDQLAFDTDTSVARIIRLAFRKVHPDIAGNGNHA